MALNIKNDEAQKLAHELVELTGENLVVAVTEAIRERLERVQSARDVGLESRLLKIGNDCAANLTDPSMSTDHGSILYDKRGLPR